MLPGSLVPFENKSLGTRLLVPRAKTVGVWPLKGAVTSFLGPRRGGVASKGSSNLFPRAETEGVWPLKGAVTSFLGLRLWGCGL